MWVQRYRNFSRKQLNKSGYWLCPLKPWRKRVAGRWLRVAGRWLRVAGYWLLVAGYWLLVTGCWLLVAG